MDDKIYPVTADGAKKAHIDKTTYEAMYANSVADPDGFWMEQGKRIDWMKPYTKAGNWTYDYPDVSIKWFEDGTLNVSANCIDRHLPTRGDQVAIIWEGDDPSEGHEDHLSRTAPACLPPVQRHEGARGEKGRPGYALYADGA